MLYSLIYYVLGVDILLKNMLLLFVIMIILYVILFFITNTFLYIYYITIILLVACWRRVSGAVPAGAAVGDVLQYSYHV